MRVLGKGKTAQAIYEKFTDVQLFDDSDLSIYDKNSDELTIVSPGIPPYNQLVTNTKNLISEYDLFKDDFPYTIWISGTNGKTTTTQMMQHILEKYGSQYGGNIGKPLAQMDTNKKIWLLETSSFTLHYTKYAKPNIYVLLPITPDHLSWHGDFKEYEKAKLKPLNFLKEGEIAIIPKKYKDYPTHGYKICYETAEEVAKVFQIDINKIDFKEPFLLDAILAMSIEKILFDKIDYKKINSFIQDKHKIEEFYDKNNRLWVDDSKATNIDATIVALKRYKNKKIYLILGGDDKGVDMQPLYKELQKYDIELFLIGSSCNKLYELSLKYNIKSTKSQFLKDAVDSIKQLHTINSVALLSPACASLDQFTSYKQRGEQFQQFICY